MQQANIVIANSVSEAIELAVCLISTNTIESDYRDQPHQLLNNPAIINIGLIGFAQDLLTCQANAIHFQWQPIAGGDERMVSLLELLK